MDPDGDYESLHSTRSLGGTIFRNAKRDDADESSKNCSDDGSDDWKGKDEEMGLKTDYSNVAAEEKVSDIDLKPSAPPMDNLGCPPSAPPLEPSLHPSTEDDTTTAPPTPESSHPPEPPGFKEGVNDEVGNYISDSVALPIGLDNADRALPVASVVPIITDATGAEVTPSIIQRSENSPTVNENDTLTSSTQHISVRPATNNFRNTDAPAPVRRVPSFFRGSSTHPAPDEDSGSSQSIMATRARSPQEVREKKVGQRSKCNLFLYNVLVVIAIAITIGLALGLGSKSKKHKVDVSSIYPDCQVSHPEWFGDGFCNGGKYSSMECGWDGGDCFLAKFSDCNVKHPEWIADGFCNGGNYDTAACAWDGGDCTARIANTCTVQNRGWLNDGVCGAGKYNSAECGYDGGDCLFDEYSDKKCNGSVRSTWSNKSRAWCQNKCLDEGSSCKAYDIDVYWESETGRCRIFSSYSSKSSKNDSKCYKKK